ncbi:MAG: hypothetical protein ACTHME_06415 [Candidatus Nitrosocosmicus sp.]
MSTSSPTTESLSPYLDGLSPGFQGLLPAETEDLSTKSYEVGDNRYIGHKSSIVSG